MSLKPCHMAKGKCLLKLEVFVKSNINGSLNYKFAFQRDENIVEKGENAGCQYFLLFLQSFIPRVVKLVIVC